MLTTIPSKEVQIHPSSYIDPNARLFIWNTQLYRAFLPPNELFYKDLFNKGIISELVSEGYLVNSWLTNYQLDSIKFIVKHEKIDFISYCYEWPASMLKDAALYILDCNIKLLSYNLIMQDAHPWNLTFHKTRPLFLDLGSIVPLKQSPIWKAYDQFCNFFLFPLYLCASGSSEVARKLLTNYIDGISVESVKQLTSLSFKIRHPQYFNRVYLPFVCDILFKKHFHKMRSTVDNLSHKMSKLTDQGHSIMRLLKSLRQNVKRLRVEPKKSHWSNYYTDKYSVTKQSHESNQKERSLLTILNKIQHKSILDVGCNTGKYSSLAAHDGIHITALDIDEASTSALYNQIKGSQASILPLTMNILNPTPQMGFLSNQFPSALVRFKSDVVVALAVIHHLILSQRQSFDRVAETMSAFSNKYLILEFVSYNDPYSQRILKHNIISPVITQDYQLEGCIRAFTKYFSKMETFPSETKSRTILFFEK